MRENNPWVFRVVTWVGEAALFCLGLVAMLALVVLVAVLSPVMLAAAVIPSARRGRGEVRKTGDATGTPRAVQSGAGLGLPGSGGYAEGEDPEGRGFGPVADH